MKEPGPVWTTILIVGHRRPWKRQFRVSRRAWRAALGTIGGVVPVALTFVTYALWAHFAPLSAQTNPHARYVALQQQVARISANTKVSLGALDGELMSVDTHIAALSALRNRLVYSAGLTPLAFNMRSFSLTQPSVRLARFSARHHEGLLASVSHAAAARSHAKAASARPA